VVALYDQLLALTGSPVVALNRAVAVSFADGPGAALADLDRLARDPRLSGGHLVHAGRADVLRRLGRTADAAEAYRRALAAGPTEPERAFLHRRLTEIGAPGA
jgi:RNA polymerase sigma-70 factor (ECF subfamily)